MAIELIQDSKHINVITEDTRETTVSQLIRKEILSPSKTLQSLNEGHCKHCNFSYFSTFICASEEMFVIIIIIITIIII